MTHIGDDQYTETCAGQMPTPWKTPTELLDGKLHELIREWFDQILSISPEDNEMLKEMLKDDLIIHEHKSDKDMKVAPSDEGKTYICLLNPKDRKWNPGCHFYSISKEDLCKILIFFGDRFGWRM